MKKSFSIFTLAAASIMLSACVNTQVLTGNNDAKTVATGAAGGANAQNANSTLEHCKRPFGTIAVIEDQDSDWYHYLSNEYRLRSTVPVLRLLIQQSNCFIVVDRGRGMKMMEGERRLRSSGELRAGSNFGKGQMVSADYALSPEVLISARDTKGLGGALGGFGRTAGVVGALLGGIRSNEASTLLTLIDNRSGVQVGVAEGSASNTDFSLGGIVGGGHVGAGLGGYTKTPQGKVIAGAFMDAYNQLIGVLRNYTGQSMGDRGLGTGGRLGVDGASQPNGYNGARINVRQAQATLNRLGYDAGGADGQMGPRTRTAIRQFQRDRGIPVTGRLDPTTQAELQR